MIDKEQLIKATETKINCKISIMFVAYMQLDLYIYIS